jgi:tetratricopeptide (TPR) repeat protein
MRITAEQWPALSRLFDEAMELPQEARESWLESLGSLDAELKTELRALLARHAQIETSDFLDTLPKFRAAAGATTHATEPGALLPDAIVGPYVIEQEIGRGGMGVVWRARRADGLLKRPVALKLLRAGFHQAATRAELQLAAGNAAEAAALGADVQKLIAASVSRTYFEIWDARAALTQGNALLMSRRAADALPILSRAVTLSAELYDRERSPALSDAQIALASCYLALGQRDKAQSLLASAEAIQATHRELGTQYTEPLHRLRAQMTTPHG